MALNFDTLRAKNVERCVKGYKHPLKSWSPLEWSGAMCGEAGEAANVAKKLRRLSMRTKPKTTRARLLKHLAEELADTVLYADLTAAASGIDLGKAIRDKFNRKSAKLGMAHRL